MASRKKSCSACVQGRRRCDLQFPQCGRCLARQATCMYPWAAVQEVQKVVQAIEPWHCAPQECQSGFLEHSRPSKAPRFSADLLLPGGYQIDNSTIIDQARLSLCPPLADEITSRRTTTSSLASGVQRQLNCSPYQTAGLFTPTSQPRHDIDLPLIPSQGENGGRSIYTGNIFQARAEYAAGRLVCQLRALAAMGQTSFIHHTQTEDYGVLRDAFAACSMSTTRNPANESLVLSEISRRAKVLIEETETAISLASPSSQSVMTLDLLPYVQAMLIYQCIRLFGTGDVAQQTQAEADAESLGRWIDILQEQTQYSQENSSCITQLDSSFWKDWVHAESIRRTMVFAELLDGIYAFLKTGWYQPSARLAQMSFIGQLAMWEARSPAEWHEIKGQKPWIELKLSSFHDGIEAAFPSDLDELAIILLVSYDGIDTVRKWVGDDSGQLEKWGLTSKNSCLSSYYESTIFSS